MADLPASDSGFDPFGDPSPGGKRVFEPPDPRSAFRTALARYPTSRLLEIVQFRGLLTEASRAVTLAADLSAQLDSTSVVAGLLATLSHGSRVALSLFTLTESSVCSLLSMNHALFSLGVAATASILELLERGLLTIEVLTEPQPFEDFARLIELTAVDSLILRVHPSVSQAARVTRPDGSLLAVAGPVGQIRESDGLEPILRLAAVWQRVSVQPLRRTQQGALYKRDLEQMEEDPVISGPISDGLEPLPAMIPLWLSLARRLGLINRDPSGERLEAVAPEYWTENAVHLPQMIATSWLGLRDWWEWLVDPAESSDTGMALGFLRPVLLLWMACLSRRGLGGNR